MAFRDDREHLRAKADALEGELAQAREELAATKRELEETKNPSPAATPKADGPVSSAWSFVFSGLRFGSTSRLDSGPGRRGGLLGGAEGALAALGAVVRLFGLVLMPLMLILAVFGDGDADDLDADGFEPAEAVTAEERHRSNVTLGGLGLVVLVSGGSVLAWYLNTAP